MLQELKRRKKARRETLLYVAGLWRKRAEQDIALGYCAGLRRKAQAERLQTNYAELRYAELRNLREGGRGMCLENGPLHCLPSGANAERPEWKEWAEYRDELIIRRLGLEAVELHDRWINMWLDNLNLSPAPVWKESEER